MRRAAAKRKAKAEKRRLAAEAKAARKRAAEQRRREAAAPPDLRQEFARFDLNHDGSLDRGEFGEAVRRRCPLGDDEVQVLFRVFDANGTALQLIERASLCTESR